MDKNELIKLISLNLKNLLHWDNIFINKIIKFIQSEMEENDKDGMTLLKKLSEVGNISAINSTLAELEFYLTLKKTDLFEISKIKESKHENTADFKINSNDCELRFEIYAPISDEKTKEFLLEIKKNILKWNYSVKVNLRLLPDFPRTKKKKLLEFIKKHIEINISNKLKNHIYFIYDNSNDNIKEIDINQEMQNDNDFPDYSKLSIYKSSKFNYSLDIGYKLSVIIDGKNPPIKVGNNANIIDLRKKIKEKFSKGQLINDDFGIAVINCSEYMHLSPNLDIDKILFGAELADLENKQLFYDNSGIYGSKFLRGGFIVLERCYNLEERLILSGYICLFNNKIIKKCSKEIQELMKILNLKPFNSNNVILEKEKIY